MANGELNGELLKNLDKNIQDLNSHLQNLGETLKDVKVGISQAFDVSVISSFTDAIRGVRAKSLIDAGSDIANVGKLKEELKDLRHNIDQKGVYHILDEESLKVEKKLLKELESDLKKVKDSVERESIKVDIETRKNRIKDGGYLEEWSDKQVQDAVNRAASLSSKIKDIEKGDEQRAAELSNIVKKEAEAVDKAEKEKRNSLEKSIKLFNQYGESYRSLRLQVENETKKDGTLTPRGQLLQREMENYRNLFLAERKEISKLRKNGVELDHKTELSLEIQHQQRLRKIREREEKGAQDKKGTAYGQKMAQALGGVSRQTSNIISANKRRLDIEERLASLPKRSEDYKKEAENLAKVNKEISEYAAKLFSIGGKNKGEKAVLGLFASGQLRDEDFDLKLATNIREKVNEEAVYLKLLKEQYKLEEQNAKITSNVENARLGGKLTDKYEAESVKRVAENEKRITDIKNQMGSMDVQLTGDRLRRKVEMEVAHQNNITQIVTRGEQSRLKIKQKSGDAEAETIRTVFDRVIADINSRAERSQSRLAKEIIDAQSFRDEAKAAAANVANELSYIWKGASTHNLDALKLRKTFSLTDFGVQEIANQIKLSDQYKANLDSLKPEARERLTEALNRYKEALQQVLQLEERSKRINEQYNAQERAINGITRRYQENEQAIQKLKDRWEELNVKKQAGLISEKDFKQNTESILNDYDRLIKKRKEFEISDLGQLSAERKSEREREARLSAKERSQIAKQRIDAIKRENKQEAQAIQEQIRLNRQITDLWKNYRQLQSNTPKNKWGYTTELVDAKNKLRELIALSKELEMVTPGSRKIASQYLEYEKINNKLKEINRQHKEQSVSLDEILKKAQHIGAAFGFMFSLQGVVNFGKKLIDTTGTFEKQFVAIRQIIGDTDAATEIWNKTMQQALQSPFKAMQLVDYTKKLAAYRIETEKLFDTTKRLADVSAGLGVEMQRLILAYGQVKAANYLRASEIRQFTEAGLNILGELSTYFTEVNGKLYTTADVMEMVTKRMVRFEDVEAIFKRITDEGGIFYNMQEVQADTVWGQIQKLHDAYDQMLNTIGSSNNGALRDAIELINKLVRNWKDLAVALQINIGTLAPFWAYTKLVSTGWSKFSDIMVTYTEKTKAGTKITHKMTAELLKQKLQAEASGMAWAAWGKKLRLAILNVRMSWLALRSAFRSFLPFLIVEGVVAITTAIINANKELREFQGAMSELSTGAAGNLKKEREEFKALREEIEKTTAGTENRRKAVDKMNSQYGEYLNNLVNEKMTVEELRKAYEGVEQAMVNAANIKLRKSIEDKKTESITKLQQDMIEDIKGEKIFEKQTTSGIFGNATNNAYIGEDATNKQAVALVEQYTEAIEKAVKKKKRKLTDKELQSLAVDVYNKYLGKNIEFYDKNIDILTDLVQRGEDIANIMAEEMPLIGFETEHQENMWKWGEEAWDKFQKAREYMIGKEKVSFDKQQKNLQKNTKDLAEYRAKLNVFIQQYEDYADRYANALYKITGFKPGKRNPIAEMFEIEHFDDKKVSQETLRYEREMEVEGKKYLKERFKHLGPFFEYTDEYKDAAKIVLASNDDLKNGSKEYDKALIEQYKTQKEYLDWMHSKGNDFTKEEIRVQEEKVKSYEAALKIRKIDLSSLTKTRGSGQKESVSSMVSLLKEMNDEYNKLSKSAYGFSKSQEKVKSSFESAFKEVYKGLGMKKGDGMILSFNKTDFTTKTGLASAYEQLLAYVTAPERIGKYTKEAASQIEKALADVRASIGVDVQVRIREDFAKQMEDAFNNYELTLDLQKLNLPSDLMEDMFNIESVDITTLRQKITDFYNDMRSEGVSIEIADYDNLVKQFSDVNKSEEERTEIISKLNDKYGEYIGFIVSETTSLEALAAVQGKVKTKLLESGGDVDRTDMEKIEQYIKKIDDMEKKAQRDRIKEYAKYLEYELSERAKISMDYAKKIADVQTERSIPVDKRDKIISGLVKERDEKLAKQDWEDFKGSEVYVQMMEDLEKHGTAALKSMREELELIRKNAKNLSPRALKEVVNAIEKIREIELNRVDPFTGLRKSIANVKKSLAEAGVSSKKELYAEAAANEKNLVLTQRRKQEVDRIVAVQNRAVEIQKELNDLTKYKEISDIVYNSDIPVEKEIDAFQGLLKKYEDDINKLSDEDKKLVKERLALAKEMGRLNDEASKDTTTPARKEEIKSRATEIENRVKEIDELLDGTVIGQNIANGIIDAIKRVIELKGEFMGISSEDLANKEAEIRSRIKNLSKTMKEEYAGNVDLATRPIIDAQKLVEKGWEDAGEGIATVFSSQMGILDGSGKEVEILVTPILPNGDVMSPQELDDYVSGTLAGANDILAADKKGIVISVGTGDLQGGRLHELQEEFYALVNDLKSTVGGQIDDTYTTEQKELSETEKRLQSLQNKYNKAIQDIDNYNKQVQRLVSKISEWAGVVQGLWSDITNMSSAYEGGFGKWMNKWGKVIDVSLQQVSKLSKAFGDFRNTMAEVEKSATKAAADKALGELGNVAEAENTAKENENTDAINRNTTSRADNTVNVIANTAAIKANTEAKIENANAGNTNGGNNNGDNVKEAAKGLVESTNSINKSTETASEVGSTVATNSNTTATEANTAAKQANAAASGLASAGNTAVGATAEAATPAVATFGSTLMSVMGWVGLIAAGLSALMSVITSIAGAHDDDIEEDIEREQRKIDELKRAYERLEKQIQKTWSSFDYMDTYDRQVENIKRQIEATERQLALERDKKDTDESKIISYQEAIDDAYDELDELKQKQIEVFGGIGEEGYRSAAEGFVDAWKEAFLETGDGLQGLQDHFDEFLQEWFVKQATMRIAGKMLEPVFTQIDKAVDKYSDGGTSAMLSEIQNVKDMASAIFPDLSEALEELAGMFDLQGEGGLSGLAAGIQGMTEEQANILEAYWNSVRMYTANIDVNVERIASILGAGGINTNPMLDKLDSIINNTSYIKRIYDMLEPLQTNNGSGRGFRTYNL